MKDNNMEYLADTVFSVVPSPIVMTEKQSSSWSMKKMRIVRRLLGDRNRNQMDEEEEERPETVRRSPIPSLSSKAKIAQAMMKIGLSSPNSSGLKEAWNVQKRKDLARRRMRWKKTNQTEE